MQTRRFGVIVGSGLDDKDCNLFGNPAVINSAVSTPYGIVNYSEYPFGNGTSLVCILRHGEGHMLLPSEVNYRGIIYAMKILSVEAVVGVSAVGSRRMDLKPRTLVAVRQYIDNTKGRPQTFFGNGIAAHVGFGQPVCPNVRSHLIEAGIALNIRVMGERDVSTLMVMEGPAFSTEAEAQLGMIAKVPLIGMTSMPEAKLAREAELCYCTLACVTDYDSGYPQLPPVSAEEVGEVFQDLKSQATAVVLETAKKFLTLENLPCDDRTALDKAIMTDPSVIKTSRIEGQTAILQRWANIHMPKKE